MPKLFLVFTMMWVMHVMAAPVPVTPAEQNKKKLMQEPLQSLSSGGQMTPGKMLLILQEVAPDVEQQGNQMYFKLGQFQVVLIYDTAADRMRLVVPIMAQKDLQEGQLLEAMQANFHSVLDVRYAVTNEVVFSVFVHPLSNLDEALFRSAIQQVVVAAATFGEEYSSGTYAFPSADDAATDEPAEQKP